jgi:hypothetical protein
MKISVSNYFQSATPFVWLKTDEYDFAVTDIVAELQNTKTSIVQWDVADGLNSIKNLHKKASNETGPTAKLPLFPLVEIEKHKDEPLLVFLMDYHQFIDRPEVWRKMANLYNHMAKHNITAVIVSPTVKIPPEIADYIVLVDYPYPTAEWLKVAMDNIAADYEAKIHDPDKVVNIGLGLTRAEFQQALFTSIACSGDRAIHSEYVAYTKEARIAKESVVKILPSTEGFESIVGLDRLKTFAKGMVESGKGRGVLLLGVPGAGKSAFAATLGFETKRTTLYLDFATLMGGIVGETESKTERALRLIDAMAPCVLVIDEIEKGLAGTSGYNGDSGTSRRQGSLFLKWLSDHTTDVYVVATANSVADLPPEFKRAERWDAIFFVDIPHEQQAKAILGYYGKKFGLSKRNLSKIDVVGLTGAEIKSICRMASALNCSVTESRNYVKPIADSMDITSLRQVAKTCAVMADAEFEQELAEAPATKQRKLLIDKEVT